MADEDEYMPKAILNQFLDILHRDFTATQSAKNTMRNPISEYQRKSLAILECEWKQHVGDPVVERPVFTSSSESSGGEFDVGDDEEYDYQHEPSEELKKPMLNQTAFIHGFIAGAKDCLPRMSSFHRRIQVRHLCDTLNVGRRLRKRFNIIRIS